MSEREETATDEPTPAEEAAGDEATGPAAVRMADAVAPETRRAFLNLVVGLAALVIFLAGIAVWPLLAPYLPESWGFGGLSEAEVDARLAPLAARLEALEGRIEGLPKGAAVDLQPLDKAVADERAARSAAVAALERRLDAVARAVDARPATPAAPAEAVEALSRRLRALEGGLAGAQETANGLERVEQTVGGVSGTVETLESRLAALERRAGGSDAASRRQGLVLAVGQLGARVSEGAPYRAELDRLAGLAEPDDEVVAALKVLEPHAERGVATLAELRRRFEPLAGEIVRAGAGPDSDGWLDRAVGRLAGLVTVRRTGEVEGTATDAVVARAEVRLAEGDLAGALQQLEALSGAAAEAAAAWRQAAEARLAAAGAVARLEARAIQLLGQG